MNNFKAKLFKKKHLFGTVLSELYSPNIPILFKSIGFDYFIIDCEHGYFDFSAVAVLAAVSKNADIPMIVRVPSISRECILKYMDMGVGGLLVPMVSSPEDVSKVVEYAKYKPLGQRGITTIRAHNNYLPNDIIAYMKNSNEDTILLAQIETVKGLENTSKIAEIQGLDGLIVGPNDLTSDMGIPGQYENEQFAEAVQMIHKHTLASGKLTGIIISNTKVITECRKIGMELLCWSSELGMIMKGAKSGLQEIIG